MEAQRGAITRLHSLQGALEPRLKLARHQPGRTFGTEEMQRTEETGLPLRKDSSEGTPLKDSSEEALHKEQEKSPSGGST